MAEQIQSTGSQSPLSTSDRQAATYDALLRALVDQQTVLRQLVQEQQAQRQAITDGLNHIKIANVNMPFISLVGFIIKVALASIPAYIILFIVLGLLFAVFGGTLAGLMSLGG